MDKFKELGQKINNSIIKEWKEQGHALTGAMEASLKEPDSVRVIYKYPSITIEGYGRNYWKYINFGVLPEQIKYPFAKARIKGLTKYAELRFGLTGKEAKDAAYAMAAKHKREGMPQPFYLRTRFVEWAFLELEKDIEQAVESFVGDEIYKKIEL